MATIFQTYCRVGINMDNVKSTITIPLNGERGKGLSFTIDSEDFQRVAGLSWTLGFNSYKRKDGSIVHYRFYVKTHIDGKTVRLHRLIAGCDDPTMDVDHDDDNFLNNTKANLKIMTHPDHSKKSNVRKKQLSEQRKNTCVGLQATSTSGTETSSNTQDGPGQP